MQTWLPGIIATDADPGGSVAFAEDLATLITAMRQVDTQGKRFSGEGRGGHLPAHDAWMEECFRKSEGLLDVTRARALWARLRELPDPGRDVMSHKDLIPGNLLVADGRLAGILDTGGFGPADPALDLVAALAPAGGRSAGRAARPERALGGAGFSAVRDLLRPGCSRSARRCAGLRDRLVEDRG